MVESVFSLPIVLIRDKASRGCPARATSVCQDRTRNPSEIGSILYPDLLAQKERRRFNTHLGNLICFLTGPE
jgi:hypothetical protein